MNSNQLFKWRRAWERGELTHGYAALLPVSVSSPLEPEIETSTAAEQDLVSDGGSIHSKRLKFPSGVSVLTV